MSAFIFAHTPQVRAARRKARRDVRVMARNIKVAAARQGITNVATLSLAAGVPLRRTALMWCGVTMNVSEMARYMRRFNLSVADLFAGTEGNGVSA